MTREYSFEAIGTRWQISARTELQDGEWIRLQKMVAERIGQFDKTYSRFRDDSLVTQMSRQAGSYQLPPDGPDLLGFYEKLYRATGGLVTPLIGQLVADAGYDADYSFQPKPLTKPPAWDDAIRLSGTELQIKRPVLLDFGAAGKGCLIDLVGRLLDDAGITVFTINAGGDILHRGSAVRVGLEDPLDTSQVLGVAELADGSLCASAGSRRRWGQFHHIINPETLGSPEEVIAVWVTAADAMTADGLATALFFTEPKKLSRDFKFEYAVLHEGMEMSYSKGFPAEFFNKDAR